MSKASGATVRAIVMALLCACVACAQPLVQLAEQLVAAKDNAARDMLLAANSTLITPDLVKEITKSANAVYAKNDFVEAQRIYELALVVAQRAQDTHGIAVLTYDAGLALARQNRVEEALEKTEQSVPMFAALQDHAFLAKALSNIALLYRYRNEFDKSVAYSERAIVELQVAGDDKTLFVTRMNLGNTYIAMGRLDLAASHLNFALELARRNKMDVQIADGLQSLSSLYWSLRDLPLTLQYAEDSLAMNVKLGREGKQSSILVTLALAQTGLGHPDRARPYHERAWELAVKSGDAGVQFTSLYNFGNFLKQQRDYSAAIEKLQSAATAASKLNRVALEANARVSLADVANDEHRWNDAITFCTQPLELGRSTRDPFLLARAAGALGIAYAGLGRTVEAEAAFREGIESIEKQRESLTAGQETAAMYMNDKTPVYTMLVELLAAEGRAEDALAVGERAKARTVLDVIRSGNVSIDQVLGEEERLQESRMLTRIGALRQSKGTDAAAALERARAEHRDFQNQLYVKHPELRVQRLDADPVAPAALLAALPDKSTVLLEYVVGENRVTLIAVAAGERGATTRSFPLNVSRKQLEAEVGAYRSAIASRDLDFGPLARQLYDQLIQPAAAMLRGRKTVVIVPDAVLWQLPFQALRTPQGKYLIEDLALFYTPSLTVLSEMLKLHRPALASVLGVGATAEPAARREALGLRDIYGAANTHVYLGADADDSRIRHDGQSAGIVHISAHGVFQNDSPMSSYLVLAKGGRMEAGRMEARDLMSLQLHASMVVLSGCETGRGLNGGGEGLIGMSWALFVAGAPATIASQWKVDAASTSELMLAFHRGFKLSGQKASALRQASLTVMKKPEFRHPFYWAGFVVMGQGF